MKAGEALEMVFAEFERNIIGERTKAGLSASRARGRKGGRPKTDQRQITKVLKLYDAHQHIVPEITELTGVSKATLYRAIMERHNTKSTAKGPAYPKKDKFIKKALSRAFFSDQNGRGHSAGLSYNNQVHNNIRYGEICFV
ncbi:hypothetical protein [Paenibacillus mucilaginosus]|uniref:hypothetical protein n=1 Tax=Paenibacillus mucilaginosus TaxID=61624 RepID=UPI003D207420